LEPMLCQNFEVNMPNILPTMKDAEITALYREAIESQLQMLMEKGFVAEDKWDGTRILLDRKHGEATIINRHEVVYTFRLPELVKASKSAKGDFSIDGEGVYINPETHREEFTGSQRRCSTHSPDPMLRDQFPIVLEAFDLTERNGKSLEDLRYYERKEQLLEVCLDINDATIRYVPPHKDIAVAWHRIIKENREGLILKQTESPYRHERSYSWLKLKNWRFEWCNVEGYTPGERSRVAFFGSLVLSKNGEYRGCVGSGFSDWGLRQWKDIFADAETVDPPFPYTRVGEPYRAAKTKRQVLVKYYEITNSNVMRFPIHIATQ
jgi:bifunctional non-homologous end joining protein LigD